LGSKVAIGMGKTGGQTLKEIKKIKNEILGVTEDIKGKDQKEVSK
jgi:hypothetical protein